MDRTCTFEGCRKPFKAKGLCGGHYRQQSKGMPLTPLSRTALTPEQRFWDSANATHRDEGECWIWTGTKTTAGYGQIGIGSTQVYAHRFSYELLRGEIPYGYEIDHMCFVSACVNPYHLRLATRKQNAENLRGAMITNFSSGVRNVYRRRGKWYVAVSHNKRRHRGGVFEHLEDAAAAAAELRNQLFTHSQVLVP